MAWSKATLLALACAPAVFAMRFDFALRKRADAPAVFVPQRLNIPLSFDSRGRIVTSVIMSPGNGQQQFNFSLTTGTGLTYVASTQCAECSGAPLYNRSASSFAQTFNPATSVPLFGAETGASVIKEFCQLKQQNGSAWPYPNQTIITVNQLSDTEVQQAAGLQVGNGLSGIIGLGSNRAGSPSSGNSSSFIANMNDSVAGQFFIRNPTAVNFTFGMQLNAPLNTPRGSNVSSAPVNGAGDPAGVLHWLMPDSDAYDVNKVQWATANNDATTGGLPTVSTNSTGAGDWFVGLDGWVMNSGNNHVSNTASVVGTVDPAYTDLYLPADQARLIHDAIPNSTLRTDLSSLGPLSQAWQIPCSASFSFGLIVGSQTFTLDENSLVIPQPDGTCLSGIEGWTDTSVSTYLFGSRFLSTVYLILTVPKNGPNQIGFAPRSSSSSSHVGAIVGGVIGGVAFIVFVAVAAFFFYYRHRQRAHRVTPATYDQVEIEKPEEGGVRPYTLSSPTNVPLTPGGESTVGSSAFSPGGSNFSPISSSAAVTSAGGFPMSSVPGLGVHEEDHSLEVAPPSYEEAESSPRPSASGPRPPRLEKAAYRSSHRSETSGVSQTQPSPTGNTSLPSPLRPRDENEHSGTGSDTLLE